MKTATAISVHIHPTKHHTFHGYTVNHNGDLVNAPCACYGECLPGQRGELRGRKFGEGHFLCQSVPHELLEAEKRGEIYARLHDNRWIFRISNFEKGKISP
jgi:hypothetical protein